MFRPIQVFCPYRYRGIRYRFAHMRISARTRMGSLVHLPIRVRIYECPSIHIRVWVRSLPHIYIAALSMHLVGSSPSRYTCIATPAWLHVNINFITDVGTLMHKLNKFTEQTSVGKCEKASSFLSLDPQQKLLGSPLLHGRVSMTQCRKLQLDLSLEIDHSYSYSYVAIAII